MKKKLISLMLCGIVAFSLVGCGDKEEKESNKESNNVVSTENGKVSEEESNSHVEQAIEDKSEYKTMTTDEAIKFNEETVNLMKEYLNSQGINAQFDQYDEDLVDGPVVAASISNGELNEYYYIGYSAEIKKNKVIVDYGISYYVDRNAIQDGTVEAPKARDLLIEEPYKIMTGDEISEELLDKIDEAIEYGCLNDNVDEVILGENGPFKITVRVDGIDITFHIVSDGDGKGN